MILINLQVTFGMVILGSVLLFEILVSEVHAQVIDHRLEIHSLTDSVNIFTTCRSLDGQPFPANGVYLVTSEGVILIDTPWDTTQFQPLLDTIYKLHHLPVVLVIATHFHNDRTGGLSYYNSIGIPTYTSQFTDQFCRERGEKRARFIFINDTTFRVGNLDIKTFYPGPGHTPDNQLVWIASKRILYGGCFIKSTEAFTPGNLADANTIEWMKSLRYLQRTFPDPEYVIPGHQGWGNPGAIEHTFKLIKTYQKQQKR